MDKDETPLFARTGQGIAAIKVDVQNRYRQIEGTHKAV
jgi:hypothetical protein